MIYMTSYCLTSRTSEYHGNIKRKKSNALGQEMNNVHNCIEEVICCDIIYL
ncbi:MAG: hypothetical protein RR623_09795 [Bacilli bacterium]